MIFHNSEKKINLQYYGKKVHNIHKAFDQRNRDRS